MTSIFSIANHLASVEMFNHYKNSLKSEVNSFNNTLSHHYYQDDTRDALRKLVALMDRDLNKARKVAEATVEAARQPVEAIDYWNRVCIAHAERNMSEDGAEDRKLNRLLQKDEDGLIIASLDKAIAAGLDPTQALNDYLDTILGDCSRYSGETSSIPTLVQKFVDHGAKVPYERLFGLRLSKEDPSNYWEHEASDYVIRAIVIDGLEPECANEYADWKNIQARDWEVNTEIPKSCGLLSEVTDEERYEYLKYHSDYLKTL